MMKMRTREKNWNSWQTFGIAFIFGCIAINSFGGFLGISAGLFLCLAAIDISDILTGRRDI